MRLPDFLQIEPVGQCNLRCRMCPIQFRKDGPPYGPPAFMEFRDFASVIDQYPNLKELHLQGLGEPMMHPRFFDMVAYASGRGVSVSTNTNLTLLSAERAERCAASGLDTIHVSIDGATAGTYEAIRVGARFRRVLRNAKLLAAARRRGGGKPNLRMVAVAMRRNLREIPALVGLAGRLEIRSVFVQHLAHDFAESSLPGHYKSMRRFVQEQTLLEEDRRQVRFYFRAARAAARDLGIELRLPRTRPRAHAPGVPGRQRCDWPWRGMYLSYRGEAMPCCMVATPDRINFGSVGEQGVERTWNNRDYQAFRDRLDSEQPPEICKTCSLYLGTF